MSDYDIIMQAAGPTLDAYFPQREPDGPLPEADDQPRDMAELEHEALDALYSICREAADEHGSIVDFRALTIATALGLKDEWLKMIEDKK